MKQLMLVVALVVASFSANAEVWVQNFLNSQIRTLMVSNTLCITNLSSPGVVTTNFVGTVWTNKSNTRVEVSTTHGAANVLNPVSSVEISHLEPIIGSNVAEANLGTNYFSMGTVCISLTGQGAAANSAVALVFAPLFKDDEGNMVEGPSGSYWSVSATAPAAATVNTIATVPVWRWPGAAGLRLRTIVNPDTDASSAVWVNSIVLNSPKP
jgi:hypothetical protein